MWIAGDAIMLGFIMLVMLMWSRDDRPAAVSAGWLEAVRRARFHDVVTAGSPAAGRGGIDDDEHLAAYNDYLARLNSGSDSGGGHSGGGAA
jgi:hypothetical protein